MKKITTILASIVMLVVATFFVGVSTATAQTTKPSMTARNYKVAARHHRTRKAKGTKARKHRRARNQAAAVPSKGAFVVNDGKEFAAVETGADYTLGLYFKEADGTTTSNVKLLGEYDKQEVVTDLALNNDATDASKDALAFHAQFPGSIIVRYQSEKFPEIKGYTVIKAKEAEVKTLTPDATEATLATKDQTQAFIFTATTESNTTGAGLAVRLKATTDNENALVSFDPTDRMKLIVTLMRELKDGESIEANITVSSVGTSALAPVKIKITLTNGNVAVNTNPAASSSPSPSPAASPVAVASPSPKASASPSPAAASSPASKKKSLK